MLKNLGKTVTGRIKGRTPLAGIYILGTKKRSQVLTSYKSIINCEFQRYKERYQLIQLNFCNTLYMLKTRDAC